MNYQKSRVALRFGLSLFSLVMLLTQANIFAQNQSDSLLHSVIDDLITEGIEGDLFPGISMALLKDDSVYFFNRGFSKLDQELLVESSSHFHLGSVGKLLTAISVLQLVDQGELDLHTNISEYVSLPDLESSRFSTPVTLHCLLTHSCGFNEVNIGYMARTEEDLLSLEEFVLQMNPGLFQEPETDIVYSNYSYALAGLIVEKIRGVDFKTYVSENIFEPLEMNSSTLGFPFGFRGDPLYAIGYKNTDQGFEEAPVLPRHATPAGSLVSTAEDMSLFIQALFTRNSRLLSSYSWELFYSEQFVNHPLLNGFSYGMERQNINGHIAWAKGGMVPGFLSQLLIVPNEFALFVVTNTDDDRFGEIFHKRVFDTVLPDASISENSDRITTTKYTGVYRDKRYSRDTEENIVSLFMGQFNLYENETQDTLLAYHNASWHSYAHIGDHTFQNTDLPYEFLVFEVTASGDVQAMYRNANIGGLSVPTSYEKTTWYNSPVFINEYYGFIPIFAFSSLFFLLGNQIVRLIRVWKKGFLMKKAFPSQLYLLLASIVILLLLHTYFVPFQILSKTQVFLTGYTDSFRIASYLGYLLIPMVLAFGYMVWKTWKTKVGGFFARTYLSLVEISFVVHLIYLNYWNFL